jgi:hypothetical protein
MKKDKTKIELGQRARKLVAGFLILAFVCAGFTAQYAHQHHTGGGPLAFAANKSGEANLNSGKHGFTCQACQFNLTHIAPSLSFFIIKPIKESFRLCLQESSFYFVFLSTHYYLRAPPTLSFS